MLSAPLVGCRFTAWRGNVLACAGEDGSFVVNASVRADGSVLREKQVIDIVRVAGSLGFVPTLVCGYDGGFGVRLDG